MRPTISEQLVGMAEILRSQIQPALSGPFPVSQVEAIADTLDEIAHRWGDIVSQLSGDNAALVALLSRIGPSLARSTRPEIASLGDRVAGASSDIESRNELRFDPLHEQNLLLRATLQEVIVALDGDQAPTAELMQAQQEIRTYLRARLEELTPEAN
jgi:hypothetical protein